MILIVLGDEAATRVLSWRFARLILAAVFLLNFVCLSRPTCAQTSPENPPQNPTETTPQNLPPNSTIEKKTVHEPTNHKRDHPVFWDRTNILLFSGVGLARGLDYASTGNLRRRGRQEILLNNDVVDNKPLFATIEAAGTASSIGLSYLFHRTGHHRLERWTSIVHIGAGTFGAIRNYGLETFHQTAP